MSLLVMAVFDTEENDRAKYTKETLMCLRDTVDWKKHRMVISDNGSCEESQRIMAKYGHLIGARIIHNGENLGTAKAINKGMSIRGKAEHVTKIDNDCVIHQSGWVEEMEEVIDRDPTIGIVGLKRKDINFDGQYIALPHIAGQRWITVEGGGQIMGTCTMFNWRLIDKIGGLAQPSIYGFDDSTYDLRSQLAGFWNCYLPHINISHIDTGDNQYTQIKHQQASEVWDKYHQMHAEYINGKRPLWEDFE